MVPHNELAPQKEDDNKERRLHNARIVTAGLAIFAFFILLGGSLAALFWGVPFRPQSALPALAGALVAMVLIRKGKLNAGIGLLLVAFHFTAVDTIRNTDIVGTTTVLIVFFVSLGIVLETLTFRQRRYVIPLLIAVNMLLVILDQTWPAPRRSPSQSEIIMVEIVAGIFVLLALVIIARQFNSYSLRGKLVSATIAVALLAVLAVAMGINLVASRTISAEIGERINTLAASHALSIGEYLARKINTLEALSINQNIVSSLLEKRDSYAAATRQEIENELKALSGTWAARPDDDPLVTAILDNDLVPELEQFQVVFPDTVELLVTDQFGAPVAATYRPDSYYQGNEKWWRDAYMSGFGSAYINQPEFDVERDDWIIEMAVPIRGEVKTGRTQIIGILQATFTLDALTNIVQAARFGETGEIEIHLPGPRALEVEDGKLVLETTELHPVVEAMQRDNALYKEVVHHGQDTIVSSADVGTLAHEPVVDATNWRIVAHQQKAEGLSAVEQQSRFNTVLGLIVIFSAGVVAWVVGTRLTKPITSLTETAVQVTQGNLEARSDVQSEDELGTLAAAFNTMTDQLQGAISNLEQRVAERTQALAVSIEVGRRLLTIHDQEELVTEVVEQVRDAFAYYHVHIYLLDEDGETLRLAGGTGEAGRIMLENQHQIKIGQGLVGQAAAANKVVLVPDVEQAENWLPNELLPETKAEAAVPISIGDNVLGVLDVQASQVNGLTEADADVLLSITNQVAIALQNARLLEAARERSAVEARINEINQRLLRTTTIEAALQLAAREIGRGVGASRTRVILQPDNGKNDYETTNT